MNTKLLAIIPMISALVATPVFAGNLGDAGTNDEQLSQPVYVAPASSSSSSLAGGLGVAGTVAAVAAVVVIAAVLANDDDETSTTPPPSVAGQ